MDLCSCTARRPTFLLSLQGELNLAYETYHTRILFFERYVRTLTYSILAYAYPRALLTGTLIFAQERANFTVYGGTAKTLSIGLPRRLAKYKLKTALHSEQVRFFVGICTKKSNIQQHILIKNL